MNTPFKVHIEITTDQSGVHDLTFHKGPKTLPTVSKWTQRSRMRPVRRSSRGTELF